MRFTSSVLTLLDCISSLDKNQISLNGTESALAMPFP